MIQHHGEEGVSEVIGAILLVGVTVLAVAVVMVALLSGPQPDEIPHATIVAGVNQTDHLALVHEGGDPLRAGEYRIYVYNESGLQDGTVHFTGLKDGAWSVGGTLTYNGPGVPEKVVVTAVSGGSETILAELAFERGGMMFNPDPVGPGTVPGSGSGGTPGGGGDDSFAQNGDGVSLLEEANFYPGENRALTQLTFSGDQAKVEANFTLKDQDMTNVVVDFILYPLDVERIHDKETIMRAVSIDLIDGNYTWNNITKTGNDGLHNVQNGDKVVMILIAYNKTNHDVIAVSARVVPVTGL